jgi:hypothetical protein
MGDLTKGVRNSPCEFSEPVLCRFCLAGKSRPLRFRRPPALFLARAQDSVEFEAAADDPADFIECQQITILTAKTIFCRLTLWKTTKDSATAPSTTKLTVTTWSYPLSEERFTNEVLNDFKQDDK